MESIIDKTKSNEPESFFSLFKTLLFALILALLFRSFLYEPYMVPTGSMKLTLMEGDFLFVSKYSYGYSRYSFPFDVKVISGRFAEFSTPQRGDIIIFKLPVNPKVNYIKRLIGLPGDRIQVKSGILYINDQEVKQQPEGTFVDRDGRESDLLRETLPEGVTYNVLNQRDDNPLDDTEEYIVPANQYFFMGDNRDNSIDSRVLERVGFVPRENLVGRAEIIFLSMSKPIWQFWTWFDSLQTDRIFKSLRAVTK